MLFGHISYEESLVQISVESTMVHSHIDIAKVTVLKKKKKRSKESTTTLDWVPTGAMFEKYLQWSCVRYAMANNFVDRCAARCRKIVIVHWTWITVPFDTSLMNNAINFIGCHTNINRFGSLIQHLSAELA